jgi:pyrimidine-nucleoside phosphorylase
VNAYEIIVAKRDGRELSKEEIDLLIQGFTKGSVPDYQMSAFLMAVYFRSMSGQECVDLTMSMVESGQVVDLSGINGFKVDKHSTGGVGDTTTLVLAPLVASCGGRVAKMTGRELGHTGGTVDKLESIPGLTTELSQERFVEQANRIGVALISQTASLAPADKAIYALRNVTATVDSIPLIASSIMSKKIAAGADGIVLDVKTGSGAFMREYNDSVRLARTMVGIGEGAGKRMRALITSMEQPLGRAVGNALEVREAIETLGGQGPKDLTELVLGLGSEMLVLSGVADNAGDARTRLRESLAQGRGLAKLAELIQAQGGDPKVVHDPNLLPRAKVVAPVRAERSGHVQAIDALAVGMASKLLGAGRLVKEDRLDPSIGIVLRKKVGDRVEAGEPLADLHSDGDEEKLDLVRERYTQAVRLGDRPPDLPRLVQARVDKDGVEELGA